MGQGPTYIHMARTRHVVLLFCCINRLPGACFYNHRWVGRPTGMVPLSWIDYLVGVHNKADLNLLQSKDSSPRGLSLWLVKWRRLIKTPLPEARVFIFLKQRSGLLDSLQSGPFRRIEGNPEEWSWYWVETVSIISISYKWPSFSAFVSPPGPERLANEQWCWLTP